MTRKNNTSEKVKDWLYLANEDLKIARILLKESIYHSVCFHSQQAAEKSLKAFLLAREGKVFRMHSLNGLVGASPFTKKAFHEYLDHIEFLDQFYIPTRYPDALPGSLPEGLPTKEDAERALDYAEELAGLVKDDLDQGGL